MLLQSQSNALPCTIASRTPAVDCSPTVADTALPSLEAALDQPIMTGYLQPRLAQLLQLHNTTVVGAYLIDCEPGRRALVRYEVSAPERDATTVVFGKIYSQPDQLRRVDQVMEVLWRETFCNHRTCGIPQPLGTLPELSMHLCLPAEGKFLDMVLTGNGAGRAIQRTAYWLGALHSHPLYLTKRFDLANELNNLVNWATLVGERYPETAEVAQELLGSAHRQASRLSLANETLIHKDFHYRHVLVGRGVKVIDFDKVRLGDPSFDLAHFCANLHLLAYRKRGTPRHFHAFERRFLHTYARRIGQSWSSFARANQQAYHFFYVYSCIKLAHQLALGLGHSPAPVGDERCRQVQMMLKQGAKQA